MLITHENIKIRNTVPDDAEILCHWWNDGKVMAHTGFPNGLGTTKEAVLNQMQNYDNEKYRVFIIEIDSKPVGEMNYRNMSDKTAQIGIKICDFCYQDKGYGTIILKLFINTLFDDLGYEKIILDTNLKNVRAQHVYEKLGFIKQKINIDSWKDQIGNLQSSIDYALTKEKWRINYYERKRNY
ncbi:MAG: GNAT family N-acetyltransferase [Clostridiales bacterium GWF2_38_85]|nr:MAG: GNAT family N-acetyltransferase [Clostridiales bacterium GWF2_38_85]HBL84640.1 GNAT family N-acetyltransferase [Clostridiales bacterium]